MITEHFEKCSDVHVRHQTLKANAVAPDNWLYQVLVTPVEDIFRFVQNSTLCSASLN